MQPLRERVRQATHEAILQAAEAVFSQRGFAGARMEEIAEQAGVSVGTLYNYFDDRRTLLDAVLDAAAHELTARLDAGLLPAGAPFTEQLERFLAVAVEQVQAHFRLYAILVEEELTAAPSGGERRRPLMLRAVYLAAEKLIAGAVRDGALRSEDAALYPALLVGMMRGLFIRQLCVDASQPLAGFVTPLARFFLHGAGQGAGIAP